MVDGFGIGGYGYVEPWGSVVFPAPSTGESVADFEFEVFARSRGYIIRIRMSVPSTVDAPEWSGRIRVLRKQGEWPQSFDDADAHISVDDFFLSSGTYLFDEPSLVAGQLYYYALYALRTDGVWVSDKFSNRDSAYPYGRWGACRYLFNSMPRGWKTADADGEGHLEQFLCIFGALVDDMKTDTEHLLTLFEIDNVHDDLLYLLDKKIAWPTWYATGGLQRRTETSRAVDLYKILGRSAAYKQMLEEVSDWNAEIVEGWRYVMFSNNMHCLTPDTTLPETIAHRGWIEDILCYTNDTEGWHSVNGLGFFLSEIQGVSGALTEAMQSRYGELIEWGKASYVNSNLKLVPITDESFELTRVLEEWSDPIRTYYEGYPVSLDEDAGATTSDASLFLTNSLTSTSNSLDDRTYHEALEYV